MSCFTCLPLKANSKRKKKKIKVQEIEKVEKFTTRWWLLLLYTNNVNYLKCQNDMVWKKYINCHCNTIYLKICHFNVANSSRGSIDQHASLCRTIWILHICKYTIVLYMEDAFIEIVVCQSEKGEPFYWSFDEFVLIKSFSFFFNLCCVHQLFSPKLIIYNC